jgi:predicted anti-sigma-YlaC factor YlaD
MVPSTQIEVSSLSPVLALYNSTLSVEVVILLSSITFVKSRLASLVLYKTKICFESVMLYFCLTLSMQSLTSATGTLLSIPVCTAASVLSDVVIITAANWLPTIVDGLLEISKTLIALSKSDSLFKYNVSILF